MNYYSILNVDKSASMHDIKKAYRKLSLIHHPDKNNGINDKFNEINEAYNILSNIETKHKYDSNLVPVSTQYVNNNIQTIIKHINITLEQSYNGCNFPLEIERTIVECDNKFTEKETIYVKINQGIDNGEIILIKEKGNVNNNIYGDIKLFINIINNTLFKREGLDLIYHKSITLVEALCGFSFNLITLSNKSYKINNTNEIISPNSKKILYRLGMIRDEYIGNMIIIFNIIFPDKLSKIQIENLQKILSSQET